MKSYLVLVIIIITFISLSSVAKEKAGFNVDVVLETTSTISGQPITLPQGEGVEVEGHVVEIKPGAEVGRHKHPYPVFMYVLEGTLSVVQDDGTAKTYQAGDALIEDANTWINNTNPGTLPTKFLAVLIGTEGTDMVTMPDNE